MDVKSISLFANIKLTGRSIHSDQFFATRIFFESL